MNPIVAIRNWFNPVYNPNKPTPICGQLDPGVLKEIVEYLDNKDIANLMQTCKTLNGRVKFECFVVLMERMNVIVLRAGIFTEPRPQTLKFMTIQANLSANKIRNEYRTEQRRIARSGLEEQLANRPSNTDIQSHLIIQSAIFGPSAGPIITVNALILAGKPLFPDL